jgi:CBS domain-containing protein
MDEWTEDDELLAEGASERVPARVLDQRMLREPVRVLTPRAPITLPKEASVRDAIRVMRQERIGCVLVVEHDVLIGIVTERDLLLKLEGYLDQPITALMTPEPETLSMDAPIAYALNKMSVGGFRHVPLVDANGGPVGIVSVKDIVDYLVDLFASDVLTVPPDPHRAELWRGRDGG